MAVKPYYGRRNTARHGRPRAARLYTRCVLHCTDGLPSPNCEGTQDNACTFSQLVTFTATFPDGSSPQQAQILGFGGAGSGAICGPPPYYLVYPLPSNYYQPETNTSTTQKVGTGYANVWLTDYTPACVRWPCGIHYFCVFGVTTQQSGASTLQHCCAQCSCGE